MKTTKNGWNVRISWQRNSWKREGSFQFLREIFKEKKLDYSLKRKSYDWN